MKESNFYSKKSLLICITFIFTSLGTFAQFSRLSDNIANQKRIVDSLEVELFKSQQRRDSSSTVIDSMMEIQRESMEVMNRYTREIDSLKTERAILSSIIEDSVLRFPFKAGYYFYKEETENRRNAEIQWLYVSRAGHVKVFTTSRNNCLDDFNFSNSPKTVLKKIKRRQKQFDERYFSCFANNNEPVRLIGEDRISLVVKEVSNRKREELFFIKGGVIRKTIDGKENIESKIYQFIGG
jgi:hypothetical protein